MKPLTTTELKKIAKELKVKNWWSIKKDVLISEIVKLKGWDKEDVKTQEYLLAGGEIKQLPDSGVPPIKVPRESSATQTTEDNEKWANSKKKRRKPSKKKSPKSSKKSEKKVPNEDTITLAQICEELSIEPRIARRKLRNSDTPKPSMGWQWAKGDKSIDNIKSIIK